MTTPLAIFQSNIEQKYYYEVCFKCSSDIFLSNERREHGEMVIIHSDRGYNIGFVLREVMDSEIPPPPPKTERSLTENEFLTSASLESSTLENEIDPPIKSAHGGRRVKFLTTLTDNDSKIRSVLESKIDAENYAAYQCIIHMRGHRLSQVTEILSTEFQFDRKKLTIYLKKYEEVSVCRLVRKMYERFKMRIKIVEVDDIAAFQQIVLRYLELSKLNVSPEALFTPSPELSESGSLFLQSKGAPHRSNTGPLVSEPIPKTRHFQGSSTTSVEMPVRLPVQMSRPIYPQVYWSPSRWNEHHGPPRSDFPMYNNHQFLPPSVPQFQEVLHLPPDSYLRDSSNTQHYLHTSYHPVPSSHHYPVPYHLNGVSSNQRSSSRAANHPRSTRTDPANEHHLHRPYR